ncbi:hypothetical protein HNP82_003002 [Catenibacillus scindens]|uniref:PsbP C-terminal domain-containing protein n=1 Tax=Catenibacillus scindens TaxID=673271 RepID=A0A7W8HCA0_9FIRM|nr:hypothetical protein [Catenibacillus scindens]MBB5265851.1 hypothetical protein [Catenibacillus scindens]
MKRLLALLCACLCVIGIVSGCSASAKEFDTGVGMTMTLPGSFKEQDASQANGATAYYLSNTAGVVALKEDFSTLENAGLSADMTLDEYGQTVIDANSLSVQLQEADGIKYFVYENSVDSQDFTYYATVFEGSDAFWLIQFFCETKNYDQLQSDFLEWAKTVKVS